MNKKILLSIVLGIGVCLLIIFGMFFMDHKTIKITLNNVTDVKLFQKNTNGNGKTIDLDTKSLNLKKGEYYLTYKGSPGYADGRFDFKTENTDIITLSPGLSDSNNESLYIGQVEKINDVIKNKYPTIINDYIIDKGRFLADGSWYGTTLTYNGQNPFIADTLKVILKKNNGTWVLMTDPPDIYLYKNDYPNIPLEIIKSVNLYQNSAIQSKYTDQ